METILTVTDVAEILKVKPITVREMFREKRLRAFKVGKSWRTTEKMLQEDIECISRNEALAPHPAAVAASPVEPIAVPEELMAPAPRKTRKRESDSSEIKPELPQEEPVNDTQQFLF